jgi:LPS O-antigen subunit length determinant protein (WzzB/FepE family)
MEMNYNADITDKNEKEIDLSELFSVLWKGKWLIVFVTSLFSILAILYSLSLPNIYQSKMILSPVESSGGGMNQVMKNMGGLANIAGINLQSGDSGGNTVKSLEKLNTLSFFENNILPKIFLPNLMALDSWSPESNKIIYDKNIYDEATQAWVRDYEYPRTQIPSAQESFIVFREHFQVLRDIDTGFVTITTSHQSPYIAQAWAVLITTQLNEFFRTKDQLEAEVAMKYLNAEMAKTSFSEIKLVVAQLLQQKVQQLTLIEASEYYVFDYIDPPAVMETKSGPARSIICIIGAFLGGLLGSLIVIIRFYIMGMKPN